MSSNVDDSLNWLATQYVLGELSESDRDAFELRLADDLTACEAVAEAGRFNLALHAALAETASDVSGDVIVRVNSMVAPSRRRSWVAVGAAMVSVACLFMAMAFWPRESVDPDVARAVLPRRPDRSAVELVSMWRSGMRVAEAELDDAEAELHEAASDVVVPGWMLAAVSLETNRAAEGQPEEWQDN